MREILFGVHATGGQLADGGDAHGEAGGERTKLFEPLDAFERVLRQRDPRRERVAGVGIDADVLANVGGADRRVTGLTQPRDGRGSR